jgi:hypothetical protein
LSTKRCFYFKSVQQILSILSLLIDQSSDFFFISPKRRWLMAYPETSE